MIKRIVGLLAAAAVLAVVVFAILGSGTYSSFIGRAGRSAAAPAATSVAAPDSTSDSLVNAPEDTTAAGIPADTAAVSGTADTLSAGREFPVIEPTRPIDRTDQSRSCCNLFGCSSFLTAHAPHLRSRPKRRPTLNPKGNWSLDMYFWGIRVKICPIPVKATSAYNPRVNRT